MKSLLLLLALPSLAATAGCVENDQNLVLDRFVAADVSAMCVVSPSTQFNRDRGLLDVGIVASGNFRGYIAVPEVRNSLPALTTMGSVERNFIDATGVNVELIPPPSLASVIPDSQRKFSVTAVGGRLTPNGGVATFTAEILPRQVALLLANSSAVPSSNLAPQRPIVTARVWPIGMRSGDVIVGGHVDFPIEICKFCLTDPPAACPPGGFKPSTVNQGGCAKQQDVAVTCCLEGATLVCGSVPVSGP